MTKEYYFNYSTMERDNKGYPVYKDSKRLVHRYYAKEKVGGRELFPNEEVHHIDGNKDNFNPINLLVLSKEDHFSLEKEIRFQKNLNYGHILIAVLSIIFLLLYLLMQNAFLLTTTFIIQVFGILMWFFPKQLRKFLFAFGILKKHPQHP